MACPDRDPVGFAVRRCPFLRELSASHDEGYARAIASNPMQPAGAKTPILQDELTDFSLTFRLFHGPSGVVPLAGFDAKEAGMAAPVRACPHLAVGSQAGTRTPTAPVASTAVKPRPAPLPLASMSLSFGNGPNFGDFLRSLRNNNSNKQQSSRRRPGDGNSASHSRLNPTGGPAGTSSSTGPGLPNGSSGSSNSSGRGANGNGRVVRGPKPPAGASAAAATGHTAAPGNAAGPASNAAGNGAAGRAGPANSASAGNTSGPGKAHGAGKAAGTGKAAGAGKAASGAAAGSTGESAAASTACPLRTWLGPMAGLVFNKHDKLVCPEVIVNARAALARTPPIKSLRPQALPVKLLAVGAMSAGANIPAGAWREHFEKFSAGWFVAVHATIPFVAMLRKAVILPKGAIGVTIVAAIAGQFIGSRLERARLAADAADREAVAAVAAPAVAVAVPMADLAAVSDEMGNNMTKQQQRRVVVVHGGVSGSSGQAGNGSKGKSRGEGGAGSRAVVIGGGCGAEALLGHGGYGEVVGGQHGSNLLAQFGIKC